MHKPPAPRSLGFTLVELMIVVAIIGLLATVALPSYFESVRKGRRADAITALQQVQQAQERWRADNPRYTADLDRLGVAPTSPEGHYTLAITAATASGYTVTAIAASAQSGDTECAVMRLEQHAGTTRYGARSADRTETGAACWRRTR